jgi:hypothetical protein
MSNISRLYLPVIYEADYRGANKISDRLVDGKKVSRADKEFHDWYNLEADRVHGENEALKIEGWSEFHNTTSSIESRADGIEKVIYAHWHRATGCADSAKMTPEVYAGHWLHAQRNREWFEGEDGKKIFALLCERYPIPRRPLLKEGYTYVWITPERSKRQAPQKTTKKGVATR